MIVCSPITTPVKHTVYICEHVRKKMCSHVRGVVSRLPSKSLSFNVHAGEFQPRSLAMNISKRSFNISATGFQAFQRYFSKQRSLSNRFMMKGKINFMGQQVRRLGISLPCQNMRLRLLLPKQETVTKIRWSTGSSSWLQGAASSGIFLGLSICFSSSEPAYSEASCGDKDVDSVHGKKVYTNYSITGIPGDGRCLFRSVAHGAYLRSGKPSPSENHQRELADELRAKVADEFIKRRQETEWFVEGDFDTYVSQMRKPHVWGGEPELFMASHVLQMPITVYMYDENAGGLISIAEYGQEYGKGNPIRVLYNGQSHYDALQIPSKSGKSRL